MRQLDAGLTRHMGGVGGLGGPGSGSGGGPGGTGVGVGGTGSGVGGGGMTSVLMPAVVPLPGAGYAWRCS